MGIDIAINLIDGIVSLPIPGWVNTAPLDALKSLDWIEKNGKEYKYADGYLSDGPLGNNNLSWTAGNATASFSLKTSYFPNSDSVYPSSASFTLTGSDKTSYKYNFSDSIQSSSDARSDTRSANIFYTSGAATSTKSDDVNYLYTSSSSSTNTSYKYSGKTDYKDGAGTTISSVYSSVGVIKGYTDTTNITYSDASGIKLTVGVSDTVTYVTGKKPVTNPISFGAGSLSYTKDNGEYVEISWPKFVYPPNLINDKVISPAGYIDFITAGYDPNSPSYLTKFPITDLLKYIESFTQYAPSTIKITSASGTKPSNDSTSTTKGSSSTTQSDSLTVASIVVDGLYKTSTNKFVFADAGLDVGTVLEDGYVPLMSSPSKGYVPKGVVAVLPYDDGSTDLLLKSGTTFSVQHFSDVGFVKGSATKLTLAQVLAKEGLFKEDFNGDGVIGDAITTVVDGNGSKSNSATGLYKTSSGSFIFADAGLTKGEIAVDSMLIMSTASKPFTTTKTIVGIAEKDSGDMEILLKSGSTFSAQKVDGETGLVVGSAKTLKAAEVEAREYYYDMDLNGDMIASLVGQTTAPAGWAL